MAKVTDLPLASVLTGAELLPVVTDPTGTPTNKRATVAQLLELVLYTRTKFVALAGCALYATGSGLTVVDQASAGVNVQRDGVAAQTLELLKPLTREVDGREFTSVDFHYSIPTSFNVTPTTAEMRLVKVSKYGVVTVIATATLDLESTGEDQTQTIVPDDTSALVTGEYLALQVYLDLPNSGATGGELIAYGAEVTLSPAS